MEVLIFLGVIIFVIYIAGNSETKREIRGDRTRKEGGKFNGY